ncbi:hypothetical protein DLM_1525 [Aquitalea magnusonii]|uniref:Uncharacterized protein n=1 Tax=Aquitalea magnusonii TaxID=332411 RepID=A0A3G9GCS1_9NEIS|nr:hypothetical protein DLM_1525 [Aquitalea magnusonii]
MVRQVQAFILLYGVLSDTLATVLTVPISCCKPRIYQEYMQNSN